MGTPSLRNGVPAVVGSWLIDPDNYLPRGPRRTGLLDEIATSAFGFFDPLGLAFLPPLLFFPIATFLFVARTVAQTAEPIYLQPSLLQNRA
jgi:hypothetical protein